MRKTALHKAHLDQGAKMGEFAGYDMPLYYKDGVMKEHEWVRAHAGLFDVSHMGQISLTGQGTQDFLEKITPSSLKKLGLNRSKYSVLTNESGGVIDDLMMTKTGEDEFHLVLNAGCKDKDMAWIKDHKPENIGFKHYDDWALLALQGPSSESVLKDILDLDLSDLPYMSLWYKDYTMFISRLGYTGEDGFEIAVPNDQASDLWERLCAHLEVKPIGLAARDSLRLEMGYPLYGHDIDDTTSPLEADLGWIIGKNNTSFIGAQRIKDERANGIKRRRVGIKLTGKGIAREGAELRNLSDEKIGALTSGGFSPSLKESIGQAYLDISYAQAGEKIFVHVRGRNIEAEIVDMPFISPKTKTMKKSPK